MSGLNQKYNKIKLCRLQNELLNWVGSCLVVQTNSVFVYFVEI